MNKDQVSGASERLVIGLVISAFAWAGGKGWITTSDAAALGPIVGTFLWGLFGIYTNRPAAIMQAAKNAVPENTQVILKTNDPSEKAAVQDLAASVEGPKVVAQTGGAPHA